MQKILIGIMTMLTLVLGLLCAVQARQLRAARMQMRVAEEARSAEADARQAQSERVKELERANRSLDQQVSKFATVTKELRTNQSAQTEKLQAMSERIRAAQAGGGGTDSEGKGDTFGKGMGDMLGQMMKDPAMREMIREQQKSAINLMYGGLFKDLNLTADEKEKLKGILTDAQMKNVEKAQSLFGGDKNVSKDQTQKEIADAKAQTEDEVKALLGPERFAQYQDYQKNIGERMQIDQFKSQLAGDSQPLGEQQAAQLMEAMKNLKTAMPPPISSDQTQTPNAEMFKEDNIAGQLKWMDDYNRQLVESARSILSPEQLKQYQSFLEQQSSMQKLGLKMAKQMFGGDKSGNPAPVPAK